MAPKRFIRLPQGIPDDVTLAVAARRAGLTRAQMLALWITLLDHACAHATPGSVSGLDAETMALQLDMSEAEIGAGLAALRDKKRIDRHERLAGWDRYQAGSTRRVQAMRARRRALHNTTSPHAVNAQGHRPKSAPLKPTMAEADTPAAIAARRARLQQNNQLIIGQTTPRPTGLPR